MMMLIVLFLILSLISGGLSFGGLVKATALLYLLKIVFFICVISLVVSIVKSLRSGPNHPKV